MTISQAYPIRQQILFLLVFCLSYTKLFAQEGERLQDIEKRLDILMQKGVPLNQKVTLSLDGSIQEMVSLLAEATKLNIAIEPGIQAVVSNSFTNVPAKDIILYLCDNNQLDVKFTGEIIRLIKYKTIEKTTVFDVKKLNIEIDSSNNLTLNLKEDTLEIVIKKISELTNRNIVLSPNVRNNKVNGFINKVPFDVAIKQLAEGNGLKIERNGDYFILKEIKEKKNSTEPNVVTIAPTDGNNIITSQQGNLLINRVGDEKINIIALNTPILEVIKQVAAELQTDYFLLADQGGNYNQSSFGNDQTGNNNRNYNNYNQNNLGTGSNDAISLVSFQLRDATFKEILEAVCKNSDYNFYEKAGVFVIGKRMAEGIRQTKIIPLKYRSAKGIIKHIPPQMTYGVTIDTLLEQNSLIVTGAKRNIAEIDSFINEIDKLIPVIMIELIIIDVKTSRFVNIGVEAGVSSGSKPPVGGTVVSSTDNKGGFDFSFSVGAINRVLRMLATSGPINLGQVSNDFYLTLKAVEENGFVEIKSTPKLATLNSHSAKLSIGQKRYYQEQQVAYQGNDRPVAVQANVFKAVEANLDINITPILSKDDQVTLEISFEQSEFLEQASPNAPPSQVSRKFESMIRIKNSEMIVLGGLERDSRTIARRGIPFLSRIPVLGWLFGKEKKDKAKDKLLIFVRPIIIN